MYRRAGLSRTMTLAVALLWAAVSTGAAAREFRTADTQNEGYPTVQALDFMGRLIAERTAGRHRIVVFHSRQLGEEKETLEQTRAGAIDLNRTNVALIGTKVPAVNVLAMPFLFRSREHLQHVLDGPIGSEILAGFEGHGFVGLAFYDSGARSVYNSVRPVRSLDDLKGLRLRVQQSEQMSDMIRALGAEPVEMPYGQVLTNLFLNAVAHAFPDGRPGIIDIQVRESGKDNVEVIVSDNGCGMSLDVRRRAFDPFFTTGRERGNIGLGLHIAFNTVVSSLNGRIALESEPGRGTLVAIEIPVST